MTDVEQATRTSSGGGASDAPKVLLVDDEVGLLRAMTRVLTTAGMQTHACADGVEAVAALRGGNFDAIISDISLPNLGGVELLRAVREQDLDVPVILITGAPSVESAVAALDLGVFKYLLKPIDNVVLAETTLRAVQLYRLAKAKHDAMMALGSWRGRNSDPLGLSAALDRAITRLWPAFQPIVSASDGSLFGYEALLRSDEPSMSHPRAILDAAERLDQLSVLGRAMRERACAGHREAAVGAQLFLNLHPQDLLDPELLSPDSAVSVCAPQIVLEVTERTTLEEIPDVPKRVAALREAGYRIAIDDLGAGYAGLTSFVLLEPEFVKLDMSLIRDVDTSRVKQGLIRSLTSISKEMGLSVVAEGIETGEERDALIDLGCDLLQGYRFGRPERTMAAPVW